MTTFHEIAGKRRRPTAPKFFTKGKNEDFEMRGRIAEAYQSGHLRGWNAAAGQGPADRPVPGRSKSSQAFCEGWKAGYAEAEALAKHEDRAIVMTRNRWAG